MRFFSKMLAIGAIVSFVAGSGWSADDDLLLPPPPPVDGGLELPPPPPPPAVGGATQVDIEAGTTELLLSAPEPVATPSQGSELTLPVITEETTVSQEVDTLPAVDFQPEASIQQSVDLGGVPGKITGGRVNIRAGQSTKYEIVLTADIDTPVTVYEKVGDWVKIAYPASEYCYINSRYISGDIPADIPEQGLVREVRGNNVNLRARPWPGSTVVGQVNAGESVFITGVRGQWVRIRPPASAKAWVFSKYVSYADGVRETAAPVVKDGQEPMDEFGNKIKMAADEIVAQSKDNPIIQKIKAKAEAEKNARAARRQAVNNILLSVDDQLQRIDREAARAKEQAYKRSEENKKYEAAYRAEVAKNYRPGPPPGSMGYDATGWVEYIGYLNNRTAGYRLVKGGETIYLLRSVYYDLDDFVGKHVRVSGEILDDTASNSNILDVKKLGLYNGTYIAPNTRVQQENMVQGNLSERVTIVEEDGFAPMIIDEEEVRSTPGQVGDSYDITGLVIDAE